jgi:hypothetical protein
MQEAADGNLTLLATHEMLRLYKAHYKSRAATPAGGSESPEQ